LVTCQLNGSADFRERDVGKDWIVRQLRRGDSFVTRSRVPYEVSWRSPRGQELEVISIHIAMNPFLAALEAVYGEKANQAEVVDFFGRDRVLLHLCFACAEMLAGRLPVKSDSVASLTKLLATYLAETYTNLASRKTEARGGLPIGQLRKVEDYIDQHLAEEIKVEKLSTLVELSPFHFSRVFKETTGMSPLQFVTRARITRAQQLIHETPGSLIEIALEVGYTSPSHFSKVFRRHVGITPQEFRDDLSGGPFFTARTR